VEKEVKIMERTALLIVVLVAALSLVEARKFCPKERNGDKCKAKKASYKCGVFFKDLSPKVPLAWLGALPEAVVRARKEGATDNDVIELLGSNVDGASYDNFECGDVGANTRCYAQMQKVRDEDYDSCGKSLVRKKWSDQADETMGDYLCGQVHRWLKRNSDYKQNGRDNIEIAFMYSQCGEDWKQVESSISGPLKPKENLCCTKDGKFRRCDGSPFKNSCGK